MAAQTEKLLYVPMSGYYVIVERYMGGVVLENITSGFRMQMTTADYAAALDQFVGEVD